MPVGEEERQVLLFNLNVVMVPDDANKAMSMTVPEVIALLKEAFAAGDASMLIGESIDDDDEDSPASDLLLQNVILIKDMTIDKDGVATILLHHGDTGAADPALMHITSGKIRGAGKKADEGVAHAAHLVISTKKHLSPSGQSRALLERVPNLGRSTVVNFVNRVIRLHAAKTKMTFVDKATKRTLRCHPKLAQQQQMSHGLKSDLENGKLSRIEFITRKVVPGFEEANTIEPITQIIVHRVVNAPKGKAVFDLLGRAMSYAKKHNFEEMQIKFRAAGTEQQVSPRFATDLKDAQDAVYSRYEILNGFDAPLEQCPAEFVTHLHSKMLKILDDKSLWR